MDVTVAIQAKLDQAEAAHRELECRRPAMDLCVWGMVLCVAGFVLSCAHVSPWCFAATGAGFLSVVYCWASNWRWGRRLKASGERVGELRRRLREAVDLGVGTYVEFDVVGVDLATGERIEFPALGVVAEVHAAGAYIDYGPAVRLWIPRDHWGCCIRPVGPAGC